MRVIAGAAVLLGLVAGSPQAQQAAQTPPPTPGAIALHRAGYKMESIDITLAPREGMEYKYRLEKGAALLYSWTSTARVHYEMHSEPDNAPRGFAETFDKQDDRDRGHASYLAPFSGIHGWYWENRTDAEVTIRLTSAGFYSESREFRRGVPVRIKRFE
ncbi:MAG: hypothetical protein WBD07_14545 [Vicinamibacterales bacterium]